MPVELKDEFEEDDEKRRKLQAREDEAREFGDLLLKTAQPSFKEELGYERWYWQANPNRLDEYKVNALIPKTGVRLLFSRIFRRSKFDKRLVAQVVRNKKKAKFDLEIVVFSPEHREPARQIAAIIATVYGDRIKIHVAHNPVKY